MPHGGTPSSLVGAGRLSCTFRYYTRMLCEFISPHSIFSCSLDTRIKVHPILTCENHISAEFQPVKPCIQKSDCCATSKKEKKLLSPIAATSVDFTEPLKSTPCRRSSLGFTSIKSSSLHPHPHKNTPNNLDVNKTTTRQQKHAQLCPQDPGNQSPALSRILSNQVSLSRCSRPSVSGRPRQLLSALL